MSEETFSYRIHPIAQQYPRCTPEEDKALELDVRANGFRTPVVIWKDEKKDNWLIDGMTRDRIYDRLRKEGVEVAANGNPIALDFVEFQGTLSDVIAFCESANMSRRSLSGSQKAAVGVISYKKLISQLAAESGKTVEEVEKGMTGEVAVRIADRSGSNPVYVYDILKLYGNGHTDLIDRIIAGDLKIPTAKTIASRRKHGLSDEPEEGEAPAPENQDGEIEKPKILDGLRNEVDEAYHGIFAVRETIGVQVKALRKVLAEITEVASNPKGGGRKIVIDEFATDIKKAIRHLSDHQPHGICPVCTGTGKKPDSSAKRCDKCQGRRYLDKVEWSTVPEEMRAIFETNLPKPQKGKGKPKDAESEE